MDDEFKRLVVNYWKTGRFNSKIDLINYMNVHITGRNKQQINDIVNDVVDNIDKYKQIFKQTNIERFFIEFLQLLDKYHIEMYADSMENDENDLRIFFESADGVFCQDYDDSIDPEAVNGFEECVNEGEKPRIYDFPAVKYFKGQNINLK